ncbi:unnamed protein product [Fraxinus pennsylvanica]|uniref:Pentatricopeptide repeat-containing protein n=1 Tax=Fraxinus pennsylvanica TaxID=56036 RepID=A0AAD1Z9D5_9LAMI|nr:unnamed protein product [Fraxinus pennsylvanica]
MGSFTKKLLSLRWNPDPRATRRRKRTAQFLPIILIQINMGSSSLVLISGILPNIDTMNYLLDSLFETGRVDTALDLYRRLDKKGCNPNSRTFEILISSLVARNQVEE